jgi:hypothetical protein
VHVAIISVELAGQSKTSSSIVSETLLKDSIAIAAKLKNKIFIK